MLLNSQKIKQMDISSAKTCTICPEKIFTSQMQLDHHISVNHGETNQDQNISRLLQLKKAKKSLTAKFSTIKNELPLMFKKNVSNRNVVKLLGEEMASLKHQIANKDADIKLFSEYQKKSEQCSTSSSDSLVHGNFLLTFCNYTFYKQKG